MIVPERKRSIRDIPIPESRRKAHNYFPPPPTERLPWEDKPHRKKSPWIIAGVTLIVLISILLSVFNGATLAYVPKSTALSFNNQVYTAKKSGEGGLLFSVIKLSSDKGKEVPASGEQAVEKKAGGTIVVYNDSSKAQRFRSTTRFKTPDGKVYQVPEDIIVPAKKVVKGASEPGSLEVKVYSEFPGEEFNIGLTDFILPGLANSSLSKLIYARSKTEMTGGLKGVEKVVSDKDQTASRQELEAILKNDLLTEARAQVPPDFILLPSLALTTFEDLPQTTSDKEDTAMINLRGHFYGVMFKKSDLSTSLAKGKIALLPQEEVDVNNLEALTFGFGGKAQTDLLSANEIRFSVTGETTAIWQTDEVALKADLVDRDKDDIYAILKNYPTIVSATTTIRPFWKSSFPSNTGDIIIKQLQAK